MLELSKVEIKNFKSIQSEVINFEETPTIFMLGKNGSGKSNILEALSWLDAKDGDHSAKYKYSTYANKKLEYSKKFVDATFYFNDNSLKKVMKSFTSKVISEKAINLLKINTLYKNTYISKEYDNCKLGLYYNFNIDNKALEKIAYTETQIHINNKIISKKTIKLVSEFPDGTALDTFDNELDLINTIKDELAEFLETHIISVSRWTPEKKYQLQDEVDLKKFANSPEICIPLADIMQLSGIKKEDIKTHIEKILPKDSIAQKQKLQNTIQNCLNKFILSIWRETKYRFNICIDGNILYFHLNEENDDENILHISSLSDGYRQFLSLIIGLSLDIKSNKVKNNLILIDEPEVHLYPKSIQYIRDEILKLSQDNIIVTSTHSPYMINHARKELYAIIENNDMDTSIEYFNDAMSLSDDLVFRSVFGIDFMSELIVGKILLVEGNGDKNVLYKAIEKHTKSSDIKIIPCRGANIGSRIDFISNLINPINTKVIALFDADKDGRKYKKDFSKNSNIECFTLSDICPKLDEINNTTLEDIYDKDFIKSKLISIKEDFEYKDNKSVLDNCSKLFSVLDTSKKIEYIDVKSFKNSLKTEWAKSYKAKKSDGFDQFSKDLIKKFD